MLRRNVLIFHSGALGDFVLTFPLAVAIARVFPQSRIFYVTSAGRGALVDALLKLEWTDDEGGWHQLFVDNAELPPRPLSLLSGATAVFALNGPPPAWVANVQRINLQARLIAVDPRVPADYAGHASQWMLEQLAAHRVEHEATGQILRSLASRGLAGTRAGGGGVVFHPGAGSPAKCWPLDSFVELGRRFVEAGQRVRCLIGEVERERLSAAGRAKLGGAFSVLEPTTPLELYRTLVDADLFIGNDSGPGHLAAIAGVPTVTLFGPTSPVTWRPLGPKVLTLRAEPIDGLSVDQVLAEIDRFQRVEP